MTKEQRILLDLQIIALGTTPVVTTQGVGGGEMPRYQRYRNDAAIAFAIAEANEDLGYLIQLVNQPR